MAEKHRFKPGQSGNPAGRKKGNLNTATSGIRELARQYTDQAIFALVQALRSRSQLVRVKAAEALLDRGYGKPTQHLEIEAGSDLAAALDRAWARVNETNDVPLIEGTVTDKTIN